MVLFVMGVDDKKGKLTLDRLKLGEKGVVCEVGGHGVLRRRFLDMGLTPRTEVFVRKVAPLGDPIELKLRGYELTIRKEEAAQITVVKVEA